MYYTEVPHSMELARSYSDTALANALQTVLDDRPAFTHMVMVTGAAHTIRMLLTAPYPAAIRFTDAMTAERAARELMILTATEARYSPSDQQGARKGWMVRRASIKQRPAAIVLAVWVK